MMNVLTGIWLFSSIIYQGQELPRPNPHLIMTLNFSEARHNTLRYERINESGFCERKAEFQYTSGLLHQKVVWTHPDNSDSCQQDQDMVLGNASITPVEFSEGNLKMTLALGDETLVYIWTRIEN